MSSVDSEGAVTNYGAILNEENDGKARDDRGSRASSAAAWDNTTATDGGDLDSLGSHHACLPSAGGEGGVGENNGPPSLTMNGN